MIDLTGQTFGRLRVVRREGKTKHGIITWACVCDCGKEHVASSSHLRRGCTNSCGCLRRELIVARNVKHEGEDHPRWKGGISKDAKGYVRIHASNGNHRLEHAVVMEHHLGRPLRKGENVHHKNGVRDDNRIENLELWACSQPSGQRIEDLVEHAVEILRQYAPEKLKDV